MNNEMPDIQMLTGNPDIALISDKIETRSDLVKAFSKYLRLSRRDRRFSDYYSEQLYGCNVPSMFRDMKNRFAADSMASVPINETLLVSEPDLYYNKKAFDEGHINLCFVIGYSGSGKSVLTREYTGDDIEKIELDDIVCIKDHYTLDELRQTSGLMYSFFAGSGSRYYTSLQDRTVFDDRKKVFVDFINYAREYAAERPGRKFILEGIWTYLFFSDPSQFDDYAVFIKGTSLIKSKFRRLRRESAAKVDVTFNRLLEFGVYMTDSLLYDGNVDKWRRHFEKSPDMVFKQEESKFRVLQESIMKQLENINSCFVHADREGIQEILELCSSDSSIDPVEKAMIAEECKRALFDLDQG